MARGGRDKHVPLAAVEGGGFGCVGEEAGVAPVVEEGEEEDLGGGGGLEATVDYMY
jgi:hypothetical protein